MDNLTNVCEATSQSQEFDNIRPTHRKGKKLLAEKKRRARINNCLMQIRRLVCEDQDEQDTDIDKMEKAEILEKTLEVLTRVRHESPRCSSHTASTSRAMAVRYASGFSLCAEESIKYIQNSRLVPSEVKVHLQNHLRAIARKVESSVQFGCSAVSSKLSSAALDKQTVDLLPAPEILFGDAVSEGSDSYSYKHSPMCYSTPTSYQHPPFMKSMKYDRIVLSYSSEDTYAADEKKKCIQGWAAQKPCQSKAMKSATSVSSDPRCDKSEGYYSDYSQTERCYFSPSSMSMYNFHDTSSPVSLANCSVIPTSTTLRYPTVYPHTRFEPHPNNVSTLATSNLLITPNVKELTKEGLDLCVKRTEDQQISPEVMWRPW